MKNTRIIDKNSKYIVSAAEMRRCDESTINHFKVPQDVLMERAALSLCNQVFEKADRDAGVIIFAGSGNNGGDGIAVARLLYQEGLDVLLILVNHGGGKISDACRKQLEIAEGYGVETVAFSDICGEKADYYELKLKTSDVIIDAMLGIGCSRELAGEYRKAVELINTFHDTDKRHPFVIAADIPTGINADNGQICGTCVHADSTVTFGFIKLGAMLYPGSEYVGELVLRPVGITKDGFLGDYPVVRYIDFSSVSFGENGALKENALLPKRNPSGNKGTFGKVLIVAGSKNVSGAMIMSAESALRSGAGMVRVFTDKENLHALQTLLPEAMSDVYETDRLSQEKKTYSEMLIKAINWCDAIVCGPGIGTGDFAHFLVETILENADKKLVLDADALNVIAADKKLRDLLAEYKNEKILTPHIAEFSRLAGRTTADCKREILTLPVALAKEFHGSIICKDARSIITDGKSVYMNLSGNDGMATAGSGDVLAGLVGALVCLPFADAFEAAVVGCFLHGVAGDIAAGEYGRAAMTARDIDPSKTM